MKIGIICASDRELAPFGDMVRHRWSTRKAMLTVCEGKICSAAVAVLYSGVCKVNAAIATQILIDTYGCDVIINCGTAGGLSPELKVLDTVVVTEAVYHDVDAETMTEFHPWLNEAVFKTDEGLLRVAGAVAKKRQNVYFGRTATGEQFVKGQLRDSIIERLAPLCVDMESAAIAHVCYVNGIPFIAVRTLTDNADGSASGDFKRNCDIAARRSAEFVADMIGEIGGNR